MTWTGAECASLYANWPVVRPDETARARAVFDTCGIVVVPGACDRQAVRSLRADIAREYASLLSKREALRQQLKEAMRDHTSLRALGARLINDSLLALGDSYRERNDGRVDLPMEATLDFPADLVRAVLDDAVLRYSRTVLALRGTRDQHWHRDGPRLFDGPAYAVNAFVYLEDRRGATQFVLGSHRWGDVWDETDDDVEFAFPHDAGTLVLADYRTVHRGVAVHDDRWLAMFVYAKPWWIDSVNYEGGDYGGFKVPDPRPVQTTALVEHDLERRRWTMFWGLVNQWEASLVWELHNEL